MRLFCAVLFTPEIKAALDRSISALREQTCAGSFTLSENLHLTLAFIGETNRPRDVKAAVAACPFDSFDMTLSGSGRFGNLWWIGIEKNKRLSSLAERLKSELRLRSFAIDSREFSPHITIAREVAPAKKIILPEIHASMRVEKIAVMKSERIASRLVYTEI